jgi:hypothetical protein
MRRLKNKITPKNKQKISSNNIQELLKNKVIIMKYRAKIYKTTPKTYTNI